MAQRGARRPKLDSTGGADAPKPPAWLKGRGLEIWRELIPQLPWLVPADSFAFSDWCASQSEFEDGGRTEWPATRRVEHRRAAIDLGIGPFARQKAAGGVTVVRRPTAKAPETKAERLERQAEEWWAEHTDGG